MIWQPKHLTREQIADRRAERVLLLQQGEMNQDQIARYLGVSEASVNHWKINWNRAVQTPCNSPPHQNTAPRRTCSRCS
jgi:DNA-binding transcriptional regulator YiaG